MSFIIAEKSTIVVDNAEIKQTQIWGDTKLTPNFAAANKANWGIKTFNLILRYGIVKTVIVGPKCCISFAGNDISYAHKLLEYVYSANESTKDTICEKAFALHTEAPTDAVEFIICTADDDNDTSITCIKEGKMYSDCQMAWIGSPLAYKALMENRASSEHRISAIDIDNALHACGDDSVGGFITRVMYDTNEKVFLYGERLESHVEREQIIGIGEAIDLFHTAEDGGFTVHFRESQTDVVIDFGQKDMSLVYTARYRICEEGSVNGHTKHFMLPLLIKTSTNQLIDT